MCETRHVIPPIAVILSWPIIVFLFCRGRGPEVTLLFAVLGGYLFLPQNTSIDLPGLYELNKLSIPVYTAMAACLIAVSRSKDRKAPEQIKTASAMWLIGWFPQGYQSRFFIFLILFGAVMTVLTNGDAVTGPDLYLPGLRLYDAGSSVLLTFITIAPMLLARKFLAHPEGQRLLLMAFFIGGLVYVPLVLFEVRMSPQINQVLYGFFAHDWIQHVRDGGYRPIVFLYHGLRVSIFLMAVLLITLGLARISLGKKRMGFLAAAAVLFVALVLTKSLGAVLIALVFCPILLLAPRGILIFASASLAIVVLFYPISRGAGLIPLDDIRNFAASISADREQSLSYRIYFEEALLARAQERPLFGWGGWGRNLYIGKEEAVPDGEWILLLGRDGWAGFLGQFGLMVFPVVMLFWRWRRDAIGMESAVIAGVLAASTIDLLPNSGLTPDKWLLAGALWGRLELGRLAEGVTPDPPPLQLRRLRNAKKTQVKPQPRRYTRQGLRTKR